MAATSQAPARPQTGATERAAYGVAGASFAIIGSRGYPSTYGGFETLVRRLAPFMVARGHRVVVYGRGGWRTGSTAHRDGVRARATRGIETKSLSTLTHGASAAWSAAGEHVAAALVLNVANGFYLPVLRAAGIPAVVNVDGLEWLRGKWNGLGRAVFRAGAALSARAAAEIVCDSLAIKEYWRETYGVDGTYIAYGADIVHDCSDDRITELGLESRSYVLAVARLVPENNVDLLLDAIEMLPGSVPVVIVGSANYDCALSRRLAWLSETRADVFALGHVEDQTLLTQLWAHAGVYWHGHSVGGTNPSLLQAMGAASPILALDTVFSREVLRERDHLVPSDAGVLAERILELMGSSRLQEKLGLQAQARAAAKYDWDVVCDQYATLLCRCRQT